MSIFFETVPKKKKKQRFQAIGVVLRNGFWDSSESLVFSVFLGLSRWICSFRGLWVLVSLVFLGLSREISSFPISEKFCNLWFFWVFWDCLKECAHFVAYGLWCFWFFWDCLEECAPVMVLASCQSHTEACQVSCPVTYACTCTHSCLCMYMYTYT